MAEFNSSNHRILRNTVFLYIRMAFVMLVTLYTVRVVFNILGEVDYGVYNVVCGFVTMFGVFNTTLSSSTSRFYNYEIGRKGRNGATQVYNCSIIIQSVLVIALIIAIEIVGIWYLNHKLVIPSERVVAAKWVFHFSVISLSLLVLQTPFSAAIIAFEKMDYLAIVSILDSCFKLLIVFLLKFLEVDKLVLYGLLSLGVSLLDFFLYWSYCKIRIPELKIVKGFDKSMAKTMLSFSGWMMLDPIAYAIKGQGSNMVLNYYHGPVLNTAYGISSQVSQALESFSGNISTAFKPQIIQSYSSGNSNRTKTLMFSMSKIIFFLKYLICIPILIEADSLLTLWLGDGFPKITIIFSQIIVIVCVVNSFAHPITVVISAIGRMRRYMIVTSIIVCSVLPVSVVLMRTGVSPVLVFWSFLVTSIINLIVCIFILSKEWPVFQPRQYATSVLFPCIIHTVVVIVIPIVIFYLMSPSLLRVLIVCLSTGVISIISAYLVLLNDSEREMLKKIVRRLFSRHSCI